MGLSHFILPPSLSLIEHNGQTGVLAGAPPVRDRRTGHALRAKRARVGVKVCAVIAVRAAALVAPIPHVVSLGGHGAEVLVP